MENRIYSVTLPHPDNTDELGAKLACALDHDRTVVADTGFNIRLYGDLGAGKTSLIRALLRSLGWTGPVKSPTFALVETYPVLNSTFNHFDFYRFEDPMEFEDAGFRDLFGPGQICATEWTQKAEPFVPDADLKISLFIEGLGRRAEITALTPAGERILAAVAEGSCEHA